ncbi:OmpA family protein [Alistipes sp. ZOR0009]|uniref:OmpA family protein n=1 Tax=Alistipes sp. ZOR0009 TaxID=1339253 RepID=UPI0018CDB3C6|nr:OmpA family protein [Alistipes sp. ZOR0009]
MTKLIMAICIAMLAANAMAQENGNRGENNKIVTGPYETNRFFDNWFIGAGGGVNLYHGENDSYGSFSKRLAPAVDFSIGKWITPSVGVRMQYSGMEAKGWINYKSQYAKDADGSMFNEKFGVMNLHADVMWNISNAFSGYKETRTWNFIPYVGWGWARSYGNSTHNNELAATAGLLNNIRLGKVVDLTLEAKHMFVNQSFDGVVRGSKEEGMSSVTVGLTFKLGKSSFKRAAQPDYAPFNSRIKELEGNNATLDNKNKQLAADLEAAKKRKPEIVNVASEAKVTASPVVLFFAIGKATLDSKELTNLEFYVKNAIKADKEKVFTLIGSADKGTGSKERNQALSEQRMQYVYDLLVNKYGVSQDRLIKKAEGDTNNRFAEPELNRAVIID